VTWLFDAQVQLAKQKGLPVPFTGQSQPVRLNTSKVDGSLLDVSSFDNAAPFGAPSNSKSTLVAASGASGSEL